MRALHPATKFTSTKTIRTHTITAADSESALELHETARQGPQTNIPPLHPSTVYMTFPRHTMTLSTAAPTDQNTPTLFPPFNNAIQRGWRPTTSHTIKANKPCTIHTPRLTEAKPPQPWSSHLHPSYQASTKNPPTHRYHLERFCRRFRIRLSFQSDFVSKPSTTATATLTEITTTQLQNFCTRFSINLSSNVTTTYKNILHNKSSAPISFLAPYHPQRQLPKQHEPTQHKHQTDYPSHQSVPLTYSNQPQTFSTTPANQPPLTKPRDNQESGKPIHNNTTSTPPLSPAAMMVMNMGPIIPLTLIPASQILEFPASNYPHQYNTDHLNLPPRILQNRVHPTNRIRLVILKRSRPTIKIQDILQRPHHNTSYDFHQPRSRKPTPTPKINPTPGVKPIHLRDISSNNDFPT